MMNICRVCGIKFKPSKYCLRQKYCSAKCYKMCSKVKHARKIRYYKWFKKSAHKMYLYQREYRRKNKHKISARATAWRKKNKIEVMQYYGNKCAICGESHIECLTIDHIDGSGAKHRREIRIKSGGIKFYAWLRKNNYPKGFRVLCWNCNCSIGAYGYSPLDKSVSKNKADGRS